MINVSLWNCAEILHANCKLNKILKLAVCYTSQAPSTPMRFQKYPFSSWWKRSTIFSSTFFFLQQTTTCFHLSTLKCSKTMKTTGTWDCLCVNHPPSFYVTIFKSLSTLEMERFQTSPLLKPFSKVFIFNGISEHFSVVDRRKRIKKYAFSNENALVWVGSYTLGCYRTVIPIWHVIQCNLKCT